MPAEELDADDVALSEVESEALNVTEGADMMAANASLKEMEGMQEVNAD